MSGPRTLTLLARREGERVLLLSPEVGRMTCALAAGELVSPGEEAGALESLGRVFRLLVPEGVRGEVVSARPEPVHFPVGWGDVLYEVAALSSERARAEDAALAAETEDGLFFRAPYSGRFWRRPSPEDRAFVEPGDRIEAGGTVGMIEVMKTFTHLDYSPEGGLPREAKIVEVLAEDGSEVSEGAPLLRLEPT